MPTDVYLYPVPSDANPNDVRLRDPTVAGTPPTADEPPRRSNATLFAIIEAWDIPPEPTQRYPKQIIEGVAAVEFVPFANRVAELVAIAAWESETWAPQRRSLLVQPGDVIPSSRNETAILAWWAEDATNRYDRRRLTPPSVDAPPVGRRSSQPASEWYADQASPLLRRFQPPPTPAAAPDDPPIGRRDRQPSAEWYADPFPLERQTFRVPGSVDNPPIGRRPQPPRAWWADEYPAIRRTNRIPDSVDNPPPRGQRVPLAIRHWQEERYDLQRRLLVPVRIDDPVFGRRIRWPSAEWWEQPPPTADIRRQPPTSGTPAGEPIIYAALQFTGIRPPLDVTARSPFDFFASREPPHLTGD